MRQYLDLVNKVLAYGTRKENRTGVDTFSYFSALFRHDLQTGFPLLTTKAMHFPSIIHELIWFLRGDTNVKYLQDNSVKIWNEWADAHGEIDAGYGEMWRRYPTGQREGFDQIGWAIAELKKNPMNRRIVISAWHPPTATKTRMSPCHYTFVLNVQNVSRWKCQCDHVGPLLVQCPVCGSAEACIRVVRPELCLHWTQRSCDIALGVPFNIASYAALAHVVAREIHLPAAILAGTFVDLHAYTSKPDGSMAEYDHLPGLHEQLKREPRALPSLAIAGDKPWDKLEFSDFELSNYNPHSRLKFKVAV